MPQKATHRIRRRQVNDSTYGERQIAEYDPKTKKTKWKTTEYLGKKIGTTDEGEADFVTREDLERFYQKYHSAVAKLEKGRFRVVEAGDIEYVKDRYGAVVSCLRLSDSLTPQESWALRTIVTYRVLYPSDPEFEDFDHWFKHSILLFQRPGKRGKTAGEVWQILRKTQRNTEKVWELIFGARSAPFRLQRLKDNTPIAEPEDCVGEVVATIHENIVVVGVADSGEFWDWTKNHHGSTSEWRKHGKEVASDRCNVNRIALSSFIAATAERMRLELASRNGNSPEVRFAMLIETLRLSTLLEGFRSRRIEPDNYPKQFQSEVGACRVKKAIGVMAEPPIVFPMHGSAKGDGL